MEFPKGAKRYLDPRSNADVFEAIESFGENCLAGSLVTDFYPFDRLTVFGELDTYADEKQHSNGKARMLKATLVKLRIPWMVVVGAG
jgi:hypothetical protein